MLNFESRCMELLGTELSKPAIKVLLVIEDELECENDRAESHHEPITNILKSLPKATIETRAQLTELQAAEALDELEKFGYLDIIRVTEERPGFNQRYKLPYPSEEDILDHESDLAAYEVQKQQELAVKAAATLERTKRRYATLAYLLKGPATVDAIKTVAGDRFTHKMLNGLVTAGKVTKSVDGAFSLTEAGRIFIQGKLAHHAVSFNC